MSTKEKTYFEILQEQAQEAQERAQERGPELLVHGTQDFLRPRRRARVPGLQPDDRLDRGQASRQGARCQAVLPAWPRRPQGAHQGRPFRRRPRQGPARARGKGRRQGCGCRSRSR